MPDQPTQWEKCAGIAKARINDCGALDGSHSFSSYDNRRTASLLPLPYTEEATTHLVTRIQAVQEFLGGTLLIENVSCYVESHD